MKATRIYLGLVMLCGTAFGTPAPIITATPTNGPTTITVHARTTDGKLPVDVDCTISRPIPSQLAPLHASFTPKPPPFVGESGDWTATDVPPGDYGIDLRSSSYAESSISDHWHVDAGTNYSIDFVLSRGATFKGRVLDDATGKPIARFVLLGMDTVSHYVHTDAEGRYRLAHIDGALKIRPMTPTNYVPQMIALGAAAEDSSVSVPDIRLQHGGWISGRVERPAGVESTALARLKPVFQGRLPANSWILDAVAGGAGTFRTEPLPSGTYTLNVEWHNRTSEGGALQTWQAKGSVSGIKVIAGRDTTNVFIPITMTIQTNGTGGR